MTAEEEAWAWAAATDRTVLRVARAVKARDAGLITERERGGGRGAGAGVA
jgi:hypothetical protein